MPVVLGPAAMGMLGCIGQVVVESADEKVVVGPLLSLKAAEEE